MSKKIRGCDEAASGRRQSEVRGHERKDRCVDEATDPYPDGEGDETTNGDPECTIGRGLRGNVPCGVDVCDGVLPGAES